MPNFRQPDKSVSRAFVQNGVYIGNVTRIDEASQQIYVEIPRYVVGFEFGPLNVACSDLPTVGDSVACLFLENKQNDVMIIGVVKNADSDVTVTPIVATSSTHPDSPKVGTILYETDTEDIYVWSGTEWLTFFEVNLPATIHADLQGTAASATVALSVADNSVVLGGDTTGNYVATLTAGTNISISAGSGTGEGSTPTLATSTTPSFSTITSTVATGTAPFTVASQTVVTNLNSDLLDGQSGSYYLDLANATGTLAIARGGTNNATLGVTNGGIVYADGSKLQTTAAGTAGEILKSNGASAPTWLTVLPVANGGTNSTVTPTNGGVGYGTGTAHAYTTAGTSGQVLQSAGAASPIWATYARGFIAQDTSTAGSTYFSSTTSYVDTDLLISPTVVSGRKYKWTVQGHVYTAGAPDLIRIALRTTAASPVLLTAVDTLVNSDGSATSFSLVYYETASSTALSRKVSVARAIGSGTNVYFFADATRTATLTLEDVGI